MKQRIFTIRTIQNFILDTGSVYPINEISVRMKLIKNSVKTNNKIINAS